MIRSISARCLGVVIATSAQTALMKVCNGQATQDKLSSDARKAYRGTCLKTPT